MFPIDVRWMLEGAENVKDMARIQLCDKMMY